MDRRNLLKTLGAAMALSAIPAGNSFSQNVSGLVYPKKLNSGDTVGVIAPGSAVSSPEDIAKAKEALDYFGLKIKLGKHVAQGLGYKTRPAKDQLEDLHEMFADTSVKAVFSIRGGYGSGRLLDSIDYFLIRKNPKIFIGYSDITALHLAIHKMTGLITFHGPMLLSSFTDYTIDSFKKNLFSSQAPGTFTNTDSKSGLRKNNPMRTIKPGKARGRLIGGNLSLICSLMGTNYEIDTEGKILFIEDVGEQPFRIDRMLNQLRLAGKFQKAAGIVIGKCVECEPDASQVSTWDLTLGEIIDIVFEKINVPVFSGLLFGHSSDQLTLPEGIKAEMDADACTITLIESGVTE